jgi:hypothetical protein
VKTNWEWEAQICNLPLIKLGGTKLVEMIDRMGNFMAQRKNNGMEWKRGTNVLSADDLWAIKFWGNEWKE